MDDMCRYTRMSKEELIKENTELHQRSKENNILKMKISELEPNLASVKNGLSQWKDLIFGALDSFIDAFFLLDKEWNILYMNKSAERLIQRPLEEIVNTNALNIHPRNLWILPFEECYRSFNDGVPLSLEFFGKQSQQWYELQAFPSADTILVYIRNIHHRKQTEEALRLSEEKFSKAFRSCPDLVAITTYDKGIFIEVNDSFLNAIGYQRHEIIGRSSIEIGFWEKVENRENAIQVVNEKGSFNNMEINFRTRLGEIRTGLFAGELLEIGGVQHIVWIVKDITDRIQTEAALRETSRRITDIINFLPDTTLVIDCAGTVIAWNKAAEELTGVKAEDIIGKGNYEYALPFYGDRRPIIVDLVLKPEQEWEKDYYEIERNGEILFGENFCPLIGESGAYLSVTAAPLFDTQGNKVGAIECIRDNTSRKQAEEALRLSEEKFSKAFNSGPSLMVISAVEDGRLFDVNDNLCSALGYSREELIGKRSLEIQFWTNPEDREELKQRLLKNQSVSNMEFKMSTCLGEERFGLMSSELLTFHNEQYMISTIVDVTDLKKMEQKMASLDRLNLVGEIAAGIGHEIRNPMTAVRGFLQMLGEKSIYAQDHSYFQLMIEELDRANSIITEFLSLARNKPVELKEDNLNRIIENLYPIIHAEAMVQDKYVKKELQVVPNLPLDEREIRQLILNLVRNGLEAMPVNKVLTIRTFIEDEEVILQLTDQGVGIDPEIMSRIGTPFLTTKADGTGLGLAICYSIADRHKAIIDVKTSSEGTTFQIRFNSKQGDGSFVC